MLVLTALFPVLQNELINYDDRAYIVENPLIKNLSWTQLTAIFTTPQVNGAYTPLTLLSWALNDAISGLSPVGYHGGNLVLHLLNVLLAYRLVRVLTRNTGLAFIAALLFGLHPMQVEAVAWASARKDTLYALFYISGLLAWLRYRDAEKQRLGWYAATLLLFLGALLSKGVAVTFPAVVLLMELYRGRSFGAKMVLDKLPLLLLSVGVGLVAISGQQSVDTMSGLDTIPFGTTVGYAVYALFHYFLTAVWPGGIEVLTPFPSEALPWTKTWLPAVAFAAIAVVLWYFRTHRWAWFGAGIFVLCLAPTLQVLPFGRAIVADRYGYVSLLGAALLAGQVFLHVCDWAGSKRNIVLGVGGIVVVALLATTMTQARKWRTSETLWTTVIADHPNHYLGYNLRGDYYEQTNQPAKALEDYSAALKLRPDAAAYVTRGLLYQNAINHDLAGPNFKRSINVDSSYYEAWLNLGIWHAQRSEYPQATATLQHAIKLNDKDALCWLNMGVLQELAKNVAGAEQAYGNAVRLEPLNPTYLKYHAVALFQLGKTAESEAALTKALSIDPDFGPALEWLEKVRAARKSS